MPRFFTLLQDPKMQDCKTDLANLTTFIVGTVIVLENLTLLDVLYGRAVQPTSTGLGNDFRRGDYRPP